MITKTSPNVTRKIAKALPIGNQALNRMLGMHAVDDERMIDICHNVGAMWNGLSYHPYRVDIDERFRQYVDLVEDWNKLPSRDGWPHAWHTVVADIYFKEDGGPRNAHRRYATDRNPFKDGDVEKALGEIFNVACALLDPQRGTLILKVGDQVHGGRRRFQDQIALDIARAPESGWYPCDRDRDVTDSQGPPSNTRKRRRHADSLVFWLAFHTTEKCPGPGLELPGVTECAYWRCRRMVRVQRKRVENYCRPPRGCKQAAYRERLASS